LKKIGFIFPGQGSQYAGMGKDLFDNFHLVRKIYQKADSVLGNNISELSFNGPDETLKQTKFTQPALFIHSYSVAAILEEKNVKANVVAGHSLGEFSALACSKVFSFEDGLKLVHERAFLMNESAEKNPGSMAAIIGLKSNEVDKICSEAQATGLVQPANYNSLQQIVISGSLEGVEKAMEIAREQGAKRVIKLPVSGAFHSQLMSDAADNFKNTLDTVNLEKPQIPVYDNVTSKIVTDPVEIRINLYKQLTHPVRWVETIQNMINDGITNFIEVGAGKVLTGLVKRIDSSASIINCGTAGDIEKLLTDNMNWRVNG
jgi:[acyl-carrier-protein] S-malonyltransferase